MLITQNGYRVYIGFSTDSSPQPSMDELKDISSCSDSIHLERLTKKWNIMDILHFPDQSTYQDLNLINQKQSIFNCGNL